MGIVPNVWTMARERHRGTSFAGTVADSFSAQACRFEDCSFADLRLGGFIPGFSRARSTYTACVFDGSKITLGPVGYATFERCSFRNVTLSEWFWEGVDLIDCTFSGVLRVGKFRGMVPEDGRKNRIEGNDFSQLLVDDVAFVREFGQPEIAAQARRASDRSGGCSLSGIGPPNCRGKRYSDSG